jgi:hypothetical protein
VGWVNVDEFYEPNVFALVSRTFERNPEAAVVYGNVRQVDVSGEPIRVRGQWRFDFDVCRIQTPIITNCAAFFRRDRLVACGGFDPSWHCLMDWEMFIRLMRGGQKWVRLKRVLGNFGMHRQSKTATMQPTFAAEQRRLREREFPGMSDEEFERRRLTQFKRMRRHMLLDGVLFEKAWFKLVRQRRYAAYFGDPGVRLPVISRMIDWVYPERRE